MGVGPPPNEGLGRRTVSDIRRLTAALADRYRIERELGQGGMATVYLARDLSTIARSLAARQLRLCRDAFPELLGEPDEQSFGTADVAEPIRLFVLNHFADELRATLAEPGERLVDVVHSEHDA
jgi:serine/threonine protein kinase